MISKNQIKQIRNLHYKKFRTLHQNFIAEGKKVITELLNSNYELVYLFSTNPLLFTDRNINCTLISEADLKKISALTRPNDCLAVFKTRQQKNITTDTLILALDSVRDPGNLGTIIRLCDWFGISNLVCSLTTTDVYNPKVVQASMGSLARVNVNYLDIKKWLSDLKIPVFGTFVEGTSIYTTKLPQKGVIIMGNEANGISSELLPFITKKIGIPRFGNLQQTESLNVATATAIILSECKRKN